MNPIWLVAFVATLAGAVAYECSCPEPKETVYKEIELKLYTSYDGIHWGFQEWVY